MFGAGFGQGGPGSSCSALGRAEPGLAGPEVCFWQCESCRGELCLWVLGTSPARLTADPALPYKEKWRGWSSLQGMQSREFIQCCNPCSLFTSTRLRLGRAWANQPKTHVQFSILQLSIAGYLPRVQREYIFKTKTQPNFCREIHQG